MARKLLFAIFSAVLALAMFGAAPSATAATNVQTGSTVATAPFGLEIPGVNNYDCKPGPHNDNPVILVHGTFGDQFFLLNRLAKGIQDSGNCVFAFDYGVRGTQDIAKSAQELKDFVLQVSGAYGGKRVDLVGHSQGGMMPRYFIKFLGGTELVDDLVGIAPSNHGTILTAATPLSFLLDPVVGGVCRACVQQGVGSQFLRNLNAGDETPGTEVDYTQITTRWDEVVIPHVSGYLEAGERTTNVTLQNKCWFNFSEHLTIPGNRTTISWTVNALNRPGPANPRFRPTC